MGILFAAPFDFLILMLEIHQSLANNGAQEII